MQRNTTTTLLDTFRQASYKLGLSCNGPNDILSSTTTSRYSSSYQEAFKHFNRDYQQCQFERRRQQNLKNTLIRDEPKINREALGKLEDLQLAKGSCAYLSNFHPNLFAASTECPVSEKSIQVATEKLFK